jgi:hypothetical protein
MPSEVGAGQTDELELLAPVDGVNSVAGGEALPRFHFDEDEKTAATSDEINLSAAQVNVARDDAVTPQTIKPRCTPFAAYAKLP